MMGRLNWAWLQTSCTLREQVSDDAVVFPDLVTGGAAVRCRRHCCVWGKH